MKRALALLGVAALSGNVARAEVITWPAPPRATTYDIDVVPHLVFVGSGLLFLAVQGAAVAPALSYEPDCPRRADGLACDKATLNVVDRSVVGNHSRSWRMTSDVLQYASLGLPLALVLGEAALGSPGSGGTSAVADLAVIYESLTLATLVTTGLKYAVHRPRPALYSAPHGTGVDLSLSFPSGHATAASAATAAYAVTFVLNHKTSPWRFAVVGAASAITLGTAFGRVAGGQHFYSDVVAGILVGGGVGVGLPLLFKRRVVLDVAPVATLEGAVDTLRIGTAF